MKVEVCFLYDNQGDDEARVNVKLPGVPRIGEFVYFTDAEIPDKIPENMRYNYWITHAVYWFQFGVTVFLKPYD